MGLFDNTKVEADMYSETEEELLLHSLNALRTMEVIDIKTGSKMGFIKDFVIDVEESKVISIILPGANKSWFSKEEDLEIPWSKVTKAGIEVILVNGSDIDDFNLSNNI
ncbi:YlmC/YmxH family sporulation protein [Clostridium sp. MB05]|uniref:YlmC/YmxH family sporulation protein n=1 Tax=Clostridium sp. MB05 TaxID=3376682 RepID=UPI00398207E2